jgi:hypothetical protein
VNDRHNRTEFHRNKRSPTYPHYVTDKKIDKSQFYQSLIDSLRARMMSESDRAVTECVNTIFPNNWPSAAAIEYGEKELKLACSTFAVTSSLCNAQCVRMGRHLNSRELLVSVYQSNAAKDLIATSYQVYRPQNDECFSKHLEERLVTDVFLKSLRVNDSFGSALLIKSYK